MSKATSSSVLRKSLLRFALILLLLTPVLGLSACDACVDLTSDTSLGAGVTVGAATTTTTTTPAVGAAETDAAAEPGPTGGSDAPAEETTTTRLLYRPAALELPVLPLMTWTRFEETDPRLLFTGDWLRDESPLASGGSFNYGRGATAGGAKVQVVFDGTQIRFVALRCVDCGIAKLTLDSWPPVYVDPYSTDWVSEVVWTSGVMPFGRHTLWIERSGDRNPAASGTILRFDAVDVMGTLVD